MSEVLKVVVVAFTQHLYRLMLLISEVSKVYCTLYTVAFHPCNEEKLFVTVFEKPFILGV